MAVAGSIQYLGYDLSLNGGTSEVAGGTKLGAVKV